MRFKGNTSGLDLLLEDIENEYYATLSEIGREATRNAKVTGTYQNQTGNLRNANGGCVVRNGRIIDLWVDSDGAHPKALEKTENLLIYSEKPKDGLYLANGMEYASFVESKGFEVVLSNGVLYAQTQVEKRL